MVKRKNSARQAVAVKSSPLEVNRAALLCFAALPLDEEDCENVLKFMGCVHPLTGVVYYGEVAARHKYAQTLIRKWVGLCLTYEGEGGAPDGLDSLENAAFDAAAIADWLSSIQPYEGKSYCKGDEITCGYYRILDVMERRLLNNCGARGRKFRMAMKAEQDSPEVSHG